MCSALKLTQPQGAVDREEDHRHLSVGRAAGTTTGQPGDDPPPQGTCGRALVWLHAGINPSGTRIDPARAGVTSATHPPAFVWRISRPRDGLPTPQTSPAHPTAPRRIRPQPPPSKRPARRGRPGSGSLRPPGIPSQPTLVEHLPDPHLPSTRPLPEAGEPHCEPPEITPSVRQPIGKHETFQHPPRQFLLPTPAVANHNHPPGCRLPRHRFGHSAPFLVHHKTNSHASVPSLALREPPAAPRLRSPPFLTRPGRLLPLKPS